MTDAWRAAARATALPTLLPKLGLATDADPVSRHPSSHPVPALVTAPRLALRDASGRAALQQGDARR